MLIFCSSSISDCGIFLLAGKGRDVGEDLVKSLQNTKYSVDEKLDKTFINFFGKKTSASSETKLKAEDAYQSLPEGSDNEESQSGDEDEDDETDVEGNDSEMKQETEIHGGRLRRKAIYKDDIGGSDATVISLLILIFVMLLFTIAVTSSVR